MLEVVKRVFQIDETSTSIEIFNRIIHIVNKILLQIGCNLFSPDYSYISIMMFILLVNFVTYMIINIYDIYLFRDDFIRDMFCLVTLGNGFQGGIKLYTFIMHRKKILKLLTYSEKFLSNAEDLKESSESSKKWMAFCCHAIFFLIVLFICISIIISIYPVMVYLIFGKRILHFGFVLPFLNADSIFGYSMNFCHHTLQIYLVIIALMTTVCVNFLFVVTALAHYDSLMIKLKQLDLEVNEKANMKNIKDSLTIIINQHTELIEYLNFFNEVFEIYYLVEMFSIAFQTTVTLFTCSVDAHFFAGYPILIVNILEIFAPCFLGTVLEIQCEKLFDTIAEFNWLDLPINLKKSMLIMLYPSKKKKFISCGLTELNLQTFVMVSIK